LQDFSRQVLTDQQTILSIGHSKVLSGIRMRKVPVNLHIPLLLPIPLHRSHEDAPQQHYSALIVGR
jgi:hypothetical protein